MRLIYDPIPFVDANELSVITGHAGKCIRTLVKDMVVNLNRRGNENVYEMEKRALALK